MSSFNDSLARCEQAAHHTGRSEMLMETSRVICTQIEAINEKITARTLELNEDRAFTGYIFDDIQLVELRAMRSALDETQKKILSL
tara:strand:- start:1546 stop:1803 length:258 start_codon:yes stop_codon:yes gene_type:complete